ncbi:hypothetical protein RZS08_66700, partial [Arthrospira platensis SPKY1]|nr:hypothetical protein [Arthrospira platensis SPKY1]
MQAGVLEPGWVRVTNLIRLRVDRWEKFLRLHGLPHGRQPSARLAPMSDENSVDPGTAVRDIGDVPAVEVVTTVALHL